MIVQSYLVYLAVTLTVTIWVAHTLRRNGRVFLLDAFHGNDALADSVNHLLVVGFYLINLGYISLALKYGEPARSAQEVMEYLSWKLGIVAVVLGVMHFFNLLVLSQWRKRATGRSEVLDHRNRLREALPAS